MIFETFLGLLLWIQNATYVRTHLSTKINKNEKPNTKSSQTQTKATPKNRETKTKHNNNDFTPNPMAGAVATERLESGKLLQYQADTKTRR